MKSTVAIFLCGLLAHTTVGLEAPIPGFEVIPFEVEVQAVPNGELLTLSGTVESIHSQLMQINPNYDTDFGFQAEKPEISTDASAEALEKRFGPICGGGPNGWRTASGYRIQDGISYLRGVPGRPTLGPGPGQCSRVSCSYNAAIWWCNDARNTAVLPGFNTIADCAQVLKNACTAPGLDLVVGQNFNGGDWNCIVRGDSC